jgi:hypothetical protein
MFQPNPNVGKIEIGMYYVLTVLYTDSDMRLGKSVHINLSAFWGVDIVQ